MLTKTDIINWINCSLPSTTISKIEQLGSGHTFCQLVNLYYPNTIMASRINVKASNIADFLCNFKLLQIGLVKIGIERNFNIEKLSKGHFQENLELANYLNRFFLEKPKMKEQSMDRSFQGRSKKVITRNKENCNSHNISMNQLSEITQLQEALDKQHQLQNQVRQVMNDRSLDQYNQLKNINDLYQFDLAVYKNQDRFFRSESHNDVSELQDIIFSQIKISEYVEDESLLPETKSMKNSVAKSDYLELLSFESEIQYEHCDQQDDKQEDKSPFSFQKKCYSSQLPQVLEVEELYSPQPIFESSQSSQKKLYELQQSEIKKLGQQDKSQISPDFSNRQSQMVDEQEKQAINNSCSVQSFKKKVEHLNSNYNHGQNNLIQGQERSELHFPMINSINGFDNTAKYISEHQIHDEGHTIQNSMQQQKVGFESNQWSSKQAEKSSKAVDIQQEFPYDQINRQIYSLPVSRSKYFQNENASDRNQYRNKTNYKQNNFQSSSKMLEE